MYGEHAHALKCIKHQSHAPNIKQKQYNSEKGKVKGKVIPLQDLAHPESSRRLKLTDFKTIGT
jgi:hypothetical protein